MDEQNILEDEDLFSCYQTLEENERPVPFVGLKNLGNSCYFNSVIQVLLHCPGFRECINFYAEEATKFISTNCGSDSVTTINGEHCNVEKCKVFLEFQKLCESISRNQLSMIAKGCGKAESGSDYALPPRILLESVQSVYPSFEPFAQQDAQECLQCLLDIFHDSIVMLSDRKEREYAPLPKKEPMKVLGGSKSGETSTIATHQGNHYSSNISMKNMNVSRTTASRKRSIKSLFKNPLKRFRESDKENATPKKKNAPEVPYLKRSNQNNDLGILSEISESPSMLATKLAHKKKASVALPTCENNSIFPGLKEVPLDHTKRELTELMEVQGESGGGMNGDILEFNSEPGAVAALGCNFSTSSFSQLEKGKSFVESLFQGEIVNESRCIECENCGRKVENFMNVSLPVCQNSENNDEVDESLNLSHCDLTEGSRCTVAWGMSSFTSKEMMGGENKYYCDVCKRYCEGERRLLLNKLPPLLTFHLKRFTSFLGGEESFGVSVSKINTCFEVPSELSLREWCSDSCNDNTEYNLFAIIVHSGTTVCSGHYLAYIKIENATMPALKDVDLHEKLETYRGQWLEADDERVQVISDESLRELISPKSGEETSRTPYLLFYCRNEGK